MRIIDCCRKTCRRWAGNMHDDRRDSDGGRGGVDGHEHHACSWQQQNAIQARGINIYDSELNQLEGTSASHGLI